MSKILIDTNFLIYSSDKDSDFYVQSQKLLFKDNIDLFTSSKNISEFLCVETNIRNKKLSLNNAFKILTDFDKIITTLYPNNESYTILKDLLLKYQPKGTKIYDFEIISIALANGINEIATFNTKDFKFIEEITLYNF